MTQNSGEGYPASGYPASDSGYPSSGYPSSGYPASGYPARPSESLAQLVQDAANQFENVAQVLGQQYDTLNNATSGLLSGTFPWTGLGSDSFASAWQNFGSYIQQLQQACQNTHDALSKLSNRISDVEGQQGWNILLTIIGGIATIISFAAMIAELGLDPFVDGFFGIVAKFTEQEGADVANVAEEITQADSEAASELEQIEADLTASPTINGSVGSVGNMPGATSPANLTEMMLAIDDALGPEGKQLVENELGPGSDGDGAFPPDLRIPYDPPGVFYQQMQPGSCVAASSRMILEDFGIEMPESYIRDVMGVDAEDGGTIKNIPQGLQKLGLDDPPYVYKENLTINDLETATKKGPVVVSVKLSGGGFHALVVDSIQDGIVYIRDPAGSTYGVPLQDFLNGWNNGKAVIPTE